MKKIKTITFAAFIALLLLSCKNNAFTTNKPSVPNITAVHISVSDIHIIPDGNTVSLVKGDSRKVDAHAVPWNASDKKITFSSDNQEIASITPDGEITANAVGNTVVTIKAADGFTKTLNIKVTDVPVPINDIEFTPPPLPGMLYIDGTFTFRAKAKPDNTTEDKTLEYSTTTPEIIEIIDTAFGTIKAKKDGEAVLIIKAKAPSTVTKEIAITVKKKPQIKYESMQAVMPESAAGTYTFEVQTIDGKLDYEPCFTSNKLPWVSGSPTITSRDDQDKDVISFTCTENKTVWDRRAYIKFKDKKKGQYIKGADGKDIEAKILQKRNEHPVVHYKWVDGIGSPAENEKEKVGINNNGIPTGNTYPQSYVFKWKETADTKFYNVRKLDKLYVQGQFPSNYFVINGIKNEQIQGKDLSQCWAKTASNMLHWWFEQNKDYIDQYKQKAAIEAWKRPLYKHDYIRGLPDEEENKKSNIANIFRAYTHNNSRGGYIEDGLTWYLYKRDAQKNLGSIYPGLFNDDFTHDTSPITIERCETKNEFEQLMNKALDNKRAIGIFWQGSKGNRPYQHAVTCWGAAYDEDNNIICLYIAESNLTEAVLYPFGVRYKGNIYEEAEKNRTYMFNYTLGKPENIYIDGLTTLDKGEEQWKAWQDKNP